MTRPTARLLFWSPRILAILFALFLGLFATDVFNEVHGFWQTALAFSIHLFPVLIVVAVLVAAWRWEWIGAVVFAVLAAWYSWNALQRHFLSWPIILAIPFPLLVIAGLFLVNWIERARLRSVY